MSTTDKAQQKLVESMRKTKAKAGGTPAPAKKTASRKRPSTKAKSRATATQATKTGPQRGADPYQAVPCVWPD